MWVFYEKHASGDNGDGYVTFIGSPDDFDPWYPNEGLWLVPGTYVEK